MRQWLSNRFGRSPLVCFPRRAAQDSSHLSLFPSQARAQIPPCCCSAALRCSGDLERHCWVKLGSPTSGGPRQERRGAESGPAAGSEAGDGWGCSGDENWQFLGEQEPSCSFDPGRTFMAGLATFPSPVYEHVSVDSHKRILFTKKCFCKWTSNSGLSGLLLDQDWNVATT